MKLRRWRLSGPIALLLVAALVLAPASVLTARAEEPAPALFAVTGVAGATLRAEPSGTSPALRTVEAGSVVAQAGPDVVTSGVGFASDAWCAFSASCIWERTTAK